jgi:hypothetical protein
MRMARQAGKPGTAPRITVMRATGPGPSPASWDLHVQRIPLHQAAGHEVTWAQRTSAVAHELAAALYDRARALG